MKKNGTLVLFCTLLAGFLLVTGCSTTGGRGTGRTFYVSAEKGSDKNRGDAEHPFKTISKAALMARPGDTVLVQEGVYRERVAPEYGGEEGRPIVYRAEKQGAVIIKGSDVYTGTWEASGELRTASLDSLTFTDDWYLDDANPFKVDARGRPERFGYNTNNMTGTGTYTLGQIFVEGKPYKQVLLKNYVQEETGTWWYNKKENQVYVHFKDGEGPDNFIEFTTRRRIFAPHATTMGLGYIQVEGVIMEHCGNQLPKWTKETMQAGALGLRSGHHGVGRTKVVRYAANTGIDCGFLYDTNERQIQSGWGWPAPGVTGNLIENNYLIDNGCVGITGTGTYQMICRNNVVMWNHNQGFPMPNAEQAGLKFHGCNSGVISDNYVADNFAFGIWLDNEYPHARVTRNIFVGNTDRGVSVEMGKYGFGEGAMIDHNVIMDNHPDMQLDIMDASGCLVVNNLIAGDKRGAVVTQMYGGDTRWCNNNAFYNNIFCNHTEANISTPYPVARAGEQRFLGNLYDATTRKMHINNFTGEWQTSPYSNTQFYSHVAEDAGTTVIDLALAGALSNKLVKLNLNEWQTFWSKHTTSHNDFDAEVMSGITAEYLPETQSVKLYLPEAVTKRLNNRWNTPYKNIYGLTEDSSYPGPFDDLQAGNNVVKFYTGSLPILERGQLPGPEEEEEPDYPYANYSAINNLYPEDSFATIFPNPNQGVFTLHFAVPATYQVTISDMSGVVLQHATLHNVENRFDISSYAAGVYLVTIDDGKHKCMKILKNKH
jgi:hypothetical protein